MGAVIKVGDVCYAWQSTTPLPATHLPSDVQASFDTCNECDPPPGACCYPDGTCAETLEAGCIGGEWNLYGTCNPNLCAQPSAACCFSDGTCQFMNAWDCAAWYGTWGGYGTDCDPNTCVATSGRCCFNDGDCLMLDSAACEASSGIWGGGGTVCEPNTCPVGCESGVKLFEGYMPIEWWDTGFHGDLLITYVITSAEPGTISLWNARPTAEWRANLNLPGGPTQYRGTFTSLWITKGEHRGEWVCINRITGG